MNSVKLPKSLSLFVDGHISAEDAARQTQSAHAILQCLEEQPGVVLGDEVGMGKTFVALAVAAAHVVQNTSTPVLVMAPGGVVSKWLRDAETFREKCLRSDEERLRFRVRTAETGVDFLKLLDDPTDQRATVIILAHGALHRKLGDKWVKLAVLLAAVKGRQNAQGYRERLARFGPTLIARGGDKPGEELLAQLVSLPPSEWKHVLVQRGALNESDDDPVPLHFLETLEQMDLSAVFERIVQHLPIRESSNIKERLKEARAQLDGSDGVLPLVWKDAMQRMNITMPLLILDEAHRVRNAGTQLASLLREVQEDMDTAGGQLSGRFERMLFLTATPFQLGHAELLNVLSRFRAIRWGGRRAPVMSRPTFEASQESLSKSLDTMQVATDKLERAWKRLVAADVVEAEQYGERWWEHVELAAANGSGVANDRVRGVILAYADAHARIREAESELRRWVLRSSRSPYLPAPFHAIRRRRRIEGAAVVSFDDSDAPPVAAGGLRVTGASVLAFLLAARLSTVAEKPRVFAEGIASSYEAMLDTHREEEAAHATEGSNDAADTSRADWYMERLRAAAHAQSQSGYESHPKLKATVDRVMKLWRRGEKVLVFCHYRQSGSALHRYLSEAMINEVEMVACEKLKVTSAELPTAMRRITDRLDADRAAARHTAEIVKELLGLYPVLNGEGFQKSITDVVLRFLRTPTFLVRFGGFDDPDATDESWVDGLFASTDAAGTSLRRLLDDFLKFLSRRSTDDDRRRYLDALAKLQTGTHAGPETESSYDEGEVPIGGRARLVANVRRVYGDTRPETRERITLTFNTPFYPEILISSSVMAEGVDLHLNCRHVVHHDLDWNPSSLEQRTGRIDRLGSRAEKTGKEIHVYLPYVEGCQDEKLFRVVMDRERWFGVVMGAEQALDRILKASPWEIERMAEEPLVPQAFIDPLRMNLAV